ncbi:hypothetical protein GTY23_23210 [Streptomyces sp. SID5998]|nr:hypothetical protein [Streptomyces sp. SID5998]
MSARISLYCNAQWEYAACASRLMTDARTVEEARAAARARGWRTHPNERDFCPACSGGGPQPAEAVVAVLHIKDQRR